MKSLGFAIIIKNEIKILEDFIIRNQLREMDKECIFLDDYSNDGTYEVLKINERSGWCKVYQRKLNFNFSQQRNYLASLIKSDYIIRIDIDEYMSSALLKFIKHFDMQKEYKDVYIVDRQEWMDGKQKNEHTSIQFIYCNINTIYWKRRVHETLIGYKSAEYLSVKTHFLVHDSKSDKCNYKNLYYYNNWEEQRNIVQQNIEREKC